MPDTLLEQAESDLATMHDVTFGFAEELVTNAAPFSVIGVFDKEFYAADADGFAEVLSTTPRLRTTMSRKLSLGVTVTKDGVNWGVAERHENGTGEVIHILQRVAAAP